MLFQFIINFKKKLSKYYTMKNIVYTFFVLSFFYIFLNLYYFFQFKSNSNCNNIKLSDLWNINNRYGISLLQTVADKE